MAKTAFLFSGQGSQKAGMGISLRERSAAARAVFGIADEALGLPITQLCEEGPQDTLNQTIYTQPCVLAVSLAAAHALMEEGIHPDGCAGFSLGEAAALCIAGAYGTERAFKLIGKRARYMHDACGKHAGGMAAVIGAKPSEVEAVCESIGGIWAVNYNCPGQTVVAGLKTALEEFYAAAKEKRMRVAPLAVSGAFHTRFMDSASSMLLADPESVPTACCTIPVYGNTSADIYPNDIVKIRETFANQLCKPVLWENTIRNMVKDGFDTFIECGPGGTLTGFFKRMGIEGITARCIDS